MKHTEFLASLPKMLAIARTFDGKRTIPSPEVTSVMLSLLDLKPADKVMEIGTGSGTQTRKLAESGAEIHSIELEPFIDTTVITGGCVFLHHGDGRKGILDQAPFSAIVASCGLKEIPKDWIEQLSEGGRLVAPIGNELVQKLTLFRKVNRQLSPVCIGAYVRFQMLREAA